MKYEYEHKKRTHQYIQSRTQTGGSPLKKQLLTMSIFT